MKLKNKTILITAAEQGIGAARARVTATDGNGELLAQLDSANLIDTGLYSFDPSNIDGPETKAVL